MNKKEKMNKREKNQDEKSGAHKMLTPFLLLFTLHLFTISSAALDTTFDDLGDMVESNGYVHLHIPVNVSLPLLHLDVLDAQLDRIPIQAHMSWYQTRLASDYNALKTELVNATRSYIASVRARVSRSVMEETTFRWLKPHFGS